MLLHSAHKEILSHTNLMCQNGWIMYRANVRTEKNTLKALRGRKLLAYLSGFKAGFATL